MIIYKTSFRPTQCFSFEKHRRSVVLDPGETVSYLKADGEELKYIYNNFRNLPMRLNRDEMIWTGEIARFILENWK